MVSSVISLILSKFMGYFCKYIEEGVANTGRVTDHMKIVISQGEMI